MHSLWRLRGYLRPYVWSLSLMLVASLGGVALAIGIPLVTRAIIDGPITERDLSALWPLAGLALLLGVTEAFLVWMRRWVQSAAVLFGFTRLVRSTMTTASAPGGMIAPVMMRLASPGPTVT